MGNARGQCDMPGPARVRAADALLPCMSAPRSTVPAMTNQDVAGHLFAGLNEDPDQRAATHLLIDADQANRTTALPGL